MIDALRSFGLSENEIKVYKAGLELGSSSVTRIAKRSGVYRTLTYEVLKSLAEQGLMISVVKEKKTYFEAAPPQKFVDLLQEKEKKVKEALPAMLALRQSVTEKPAVMFYEGKEGIKTVSEDVLAHTKELLGVSAKKAMKNLLKWYFPDFVERRVRAGIHVRVLVDEAPLTTQMLDYRIVRKKISTGYWIYGNKFAILNFHEKDPFAVVVESEEFAKVMRMTFELAWRGASR